MKIVIIKNAYFAARIIPSTAALSLLLYLKKNRRSSSLANELALIVYLIIILVNRVLPSYYLSNVPDIRRYNKVAWAKYKVT